MNRIVLIAAAVLVVAAYVAGFWPQHRRLAVARHDAQLLRVQFDRADSQNRLGEILGQLLNLSDAISARNYGRAEALSTGYFDRVTQEASRTGDAGTRKALKAILDTRDNVTTAIARTDPSISQVLRRQEISLRLALGYPAESSQSEDRS